MFADLTNQQGLADQMKRMIRADNHAERADKQQALDRLAEFESVQWQPQVFAAAIVAAEPGRFEYADGTLTYRGAPAAKSAAGAVSRVIGVYLAVLSIAIPPRKYNVEEAAAYLGLEPETVRYHVYTSKYLKGELKSRRLSFTQTELDSFKLNKPDAGRKPNAASG